MGSRRDVTRRSGRQGSGGGSGGGPGSGASDPLDVLLEDALRRLYAKVETDPLPAPMAELARKLEERLARPDDAGDSDDASDSDTDPESR